MCNSKAPLPDPRASIAFPDAIAIIGLLGDNRLALNICIHSIPVNIRSTIPNRCVSFHYVRIIVENHLHLSLGWLVLLPMRVLFIDPAWSACHCQTGLPRRSVNLFQWIDVANFLIPKQWTSGRAITAHSTTSDVRCRSDLVFDFGFIIGIGSIIKVPGSNQDIIKDFGIAGTIQALQLPHYFILLLEHMLLKSQSRNQILIYQIKF